MDSINVQTQAYALRALASEDIVRINRLKIRAKLNQNSIADTYNSRVNRRDLLDMK